MPGAGSTVLALDTPAHATDTEVADEIAFNSVPFIPGANQCGTTFVAPTSGKVLILWGVRAQVNTASARVHVSVAVRAGSTIGAGTSISPSSDESSIETAQPVAAGVGPPTRIQASRHRVVTGLTAGNTYNVQVEHKTSIAASGDIYLRDVDVIPIVT